MNTAPAAPSVPVSAATPPGRALLGLLTLRLFGLLRPKAWIRFALAAAAVVVITRIWVRPHHADALTEWTETIFTLRILPLMCLVAGGFLRNEIRASTVEYLWTRPASKLVLALGSWAASVAMVACTAFVVTFLILGTASVGGVTGAWDHALRLLSAQLACTAAFTAIATALATLTNRFMVVGIVYGLAIESALSRIPTFLSQFTATRHVTTLLDPKATGSALLGGWIGCLAIAAVALTVAVVVFSRRQYATKGE